MFHVVHILWNNQHRGYELWFNNKRCIALKYRLNLKKHEAYKLKRLFNGER